MFPTVSGNWYATSVDTFVDGEAAYRDINTHAINQNTIEKKVLLNTESESNYKHLDDW